MAGLEAAIERLEGGSLTLEEAIAEFEGGFRAWRDCQNLLRRAEKRIEVLCEEAEADGGTAFVWKPVRADADSDFVALDRTRGETAAPSHAADADDEDSDESAANG